MTAPIYKVMSQDEWTAFDRAGTYAGSALDQADGYVHLCASDQVAGTVLHHFADRTGLVALAIDKDRMGKALKWEPSRDGVPFPHFHGTLTRDMVLSADPLPDDPDQRALTLALLAV